MAFPAHAPSGPHPACGAGAWDAWEPARPGPGCGHRAPHAAGRYRASAPPTGAAGLLAGGKAARMAAGCKSAHMAVVQALPVFKAMLGAPSREGSKVTLVGGLRMPGQVPLLRQATQEISACGVGLLVHRGRGCRRSVARQRIADQLAPGVRENPCSCPGGSDHGWGCPAPAGPAGIRRPAAPVPPSRCCRCRCRR